MILFGADSFFMFVAQRNCPIVFYIPNSHDYSGPSLPEACIFRLSLLVVSLW
jgi:hypothetical protein